MAKIKIQKKDIWIDMTPMSDRDDFVALLLYVDINILDARAYPSHCA